MEVPCDMDTKVLNRVGDDRIDETDIDGVVELVSTRTYDNGVEDDPSEADNEAIDLMVDAVLGVFVDPGCVDA